MPKMIKWYTHQFKVEWL